MSDDWRIPTKNELREAIDKAHDAEVKSLRDELARVKGHLKTMITDSCEDREAMADLCRKAGIHDSQINGDSHGVPGTMDLADMLAAKLAAAVAERDELREALRPFAAYSTFADKYTDNPERDDRQIGMQISNATGSVRIEYGDCRRAAALVARLDSTPAG